MAFFLFVSERNLYGKSAAKEVGVRPIHVWWTRGESNPCPKIYSYSFLRAKFVFWNSPLATPANRLYDRVAFLFMTASKANGLCTFTAV